MPETLTYSRIREFKSCPRSHYYKYELGVRPVRSANALNLGAAVHEGLDAWEKARMRGEEDPPAVGIQAVQDFCSTVANTQYRNAPPEDYEAFVTLWQTALTLVHAYFAYWGDDESVVLESEQSFNAPIINPESGHQTPNFVAAGKLDKIVRLGDGRLALREHKTVGDDISPDSDYWQRLAIDEQISHYMLNARAMGYDLEAVQYDVIRKPTISRKQVPVLDEYGKKIVVDGDGTRVFKKDGSPRESADSAKGYTLQNRTETPGEYGGRLWEDIQSRPEHYFARREIARTPGDIEEWQDDLWQAQLSIRRAQRTNKWPRNSHACRSFGKCPFFDICTAGSGLDPENLPDGFETVPNVNPEL